MSKPAKCIWDQLVDEMAGAAVLRRVDQRALWQLAEDEAMLDDFYSGLREMAKRLKEKARAEGRELPASELLLLLTMPNGVRALRALRDVAGRVIVERREFGLTPSSRSRVSTTAAAAAEDALELALCG